MNYFKLNMEIIDECDGFYTLHIADKDDESMLKFSPDKKEIIYVDNSKLTQFIKLQEYQIRKLLHNKRPKSFYIGFKLNFVLTDELPNTDFYDRTKITVLDNTKNGFVVKKTNTKTPNIPELYTDGSFNHETKQGGFAILIKTINKEYLLNQTKINNRDNNSIELLAVIEGIKNLKEERKIRIITDSQYVIKGVTEWLPIWKINDFYTANGTKAKNIDEWKEIDQLIKEKYLEFEWVKSHSDHFENTICDMKAKSTYKNKSDEKN